jgi:hypothetical protein
MPTIHIETSTPAHSALAVKNRGQRPRRSGLAAVALGVQPHFFLEHLPESLFFQLADFSVVGEFEFVDMGG